MGSLVDRSLAGLVTLRVLISVMQADKRFNVPHTWTLVALSSESEVRVKSLKLEWAAHRETSASLIKDKTSIIHGKLNLTCQGAMVPIGTSDDFSYYSGYSK